MLVFFRDFFTRAVEYLFFDLPIYFELLFSQRKRNILVTPSTSSGIPTEETTNSTKESLISSVKRINRLRNNKVEFLEGVPHTLSPQVRRIFHKF